ncbi:hypothetical protein QTJ16_002051 [Diplocarpon rosae]|uniref:WSC domain-containing protein n=1 Tax=Diplocarpon rosae TaxID=946125 RepID=A0AAD9T4Y1_9HELO|nr:hypothetical protein QTJ16_002051 [Diplocarpon rosae]PBP23072.1 WSC domain containing protein [Diplocarpon rosae]
MKSILARLAATAWLAATKVVALERTYAGCYASDTSLVFNSTIEFNSRGSCGDACYAQQYPVMAMTNASYCFCSETLPPQITNSTSSKCNVVCPGFGSESCGARGYWSVYLTGLTTDVANADPAPDDASPTAGTTKSTSKPAVVTVGGETVVVTAGSQATSAASASATPKSSGGGPSKAGIAAGVVAGVLCVAAILGGLFFYMRSRKRREIEAEYKRNAAVNSFISGGKPPASSETNSSFTDTRLDPAVMAQRRQSDGSIADNQDYSRRILKVTNA